MWMNATELAYGNGTEVELIEKHLGGLSAISQGTKS